MLLAKYNGEDWDYFRDEVEMFIGRRSFPCRLIAINSNWRGETGYAEATDFDDIMAKLVSFDSSFYELHKVGNGYEFRLATHDRPTGFTMQIRSK